MGAKTVGLLKMLINEQDAGSCLDAVGSKHTRVDEWVYRVSI